MRAGNLCVLLGCLALVVSGCAGRAGKETAGAPTKARQIEKPWIGVHFFVPPRDGLPLVKRMITEALAPMGVNALVLEVNYRFAYQSHPELNELGPQAMTRADARELADLCRAHGIRLIPQFNCLGHQSWGTGASTLPLLAKYPELDETPWVPADNKGIYCRSWCPLHPKVNEMVFALMDELIDAFQPDAFHVGMDEVFLIADSQCPRCQGKDPAELFARAVNDYHAHLVGEKKLMMLMWGDRLLDLSVMKYNMWEASKNGTAPAIDRIPKDIILCDWHYGKRPEYPSAPYFQEKGFRVWPASWNRADAALALLDYARSHAAKKMIGHLCTTWVSTTDLAKALLQEGDASQFSKDVQGAVEALRACVKAMKP